MLALAFVLEAPLSCQDMAARHAPLAPKPRKRTDKTLLENKRRVEALKLGVEDPL